MARLSGSKWVPEHASPNAVAPHHYVEDMAGPEIEGPEDDGDEEESMTWSVVMAAVVVPVTLYLVGNWILKSCTGLDMDPAFWL